MFLSSGDKKPFVGHARTSSRTWPVQIYGGPIIDIRFCNQQCNQTWKIAEKVLFLVYNDVAIARFEPTVIVTKNNTSTNPITLSRKRNVEKSTAVEIPILKSCLFISGLRKDLSLNRAKKLIAKCSKIIGGGKLFYA